MGRHVWTQTPWLVEDMKLYYVKSTTASCSSQPNSRTMQLELLKATVDSLNEDKAPVGSGSAGEKVAEITRLLQTSDKLEMTLREEKEHFERATLRKSTYLMIMQALT